MDKPAACKLKGKAGFLKPHTNSKQVQRANLISNQHTQSKERKGALYLTSLSSDNCTEALFPLRKQENQYNIGKVNP